MQKIIPFIWFDDAAEPAARLYTTLVAGSAIARTLRYGKAGHAQHGQPEGTVQTMEFTLGDTRMVRPERRPALSPDTCSVVFRDAGDGRGSGSVLGRAG